MSAVSFRWVEGWQALAPVTQGWAELVARTQGEVFLSPSWLAAWWPEQGRGLRLVTLLAEDEGRIRGLLPFVIDRFWLGPLPLRIARLAGTDPNAIVLTLPIEPELQADMLAQAAQDLLGRFSASLVSFTPLSDRAAHLKDLENAASSGGFLLTRQAQGTHCLFELPEKFETYLETRISPKRRGQIRREIAGLKQAFAMESHEISPDPADFDTFLALHERQWQAVGKGGHFRDWPRSASVYRRLAAHSSPLRLFTLTGNDGVLSTQMCLVFGPTCHWRLPARRLDPRADKLSIGKIGLVLMIESLIAQGITHIEGGRGIYDYKTQAGGQDLTVWRAILSRDRTMSRLILRLCLFWAGLVDLVHYRLWFKKVAPTLRQVMGLPARPLWRLWIGSRI